MFNKYFIDINFETLQKTLPGIKPIQKAHHIVKKKTIKRSKIKFLVFSFIYTSYKNEPQKKALYKRGKHPFCCLRLYISVKIVKSSI